MHLARQNTSPTSVISPNMQMPQLHNPSESRVANRFLLRKPVSSHAGKSRLASSQRCPCGKPPASKAQPHRRQKHVVLAAAATASAPRSKTSNKKRKQVEPLLVVEDISKSHDGQRFLFDGLNFTVSSGDRLALVGPNGAGKSSLFNLLSGMLASQQLRVLAQAASPNNIVHSVWCVQMQMQTSLTLVPSSARKA